jgi:hypothetical protein
MVYQVITQLGTRLDCLSTEAKASDPWGTLLVLSLWLTADGCFRQLLVPHSVSSATAPVVMILTREAELGREECFVRVRPAPPECRDVVPEARTILKSVKHFLLAPPLVLGSFDGDCLITI